MATGIVPDESDQLEEGLFHVLSRLGARLDVGHLELVAYALDHLVGDFALSLQVALVAYEYHGKLVVVLDSHDLFVQAIDFGHSKSSTSFVSFRVRDTPGVV